MSIWSSIETPEPMTAGSSIPGGTPLELDVATALSWGNRVRLTGWNEEEDFEVHITPEALDLLIDALTKARETVAAYQERVIIAPETQEEAPCAEASN